MAPHTGNEEEVSDDESFVSARGLSRASTMASDQTVRDDKPSPCPAPPPATKPKPELRPKPNKPNTKPPSPAALAAATASSSAAAAAAAQKQPPAVRPKPTNASSSAAQLAHAARQPPRVNPKPELKPPAQSTGRQRSPGRANVGNRSSVDAGTSMANTSMAAEDERKPAVVNPKPQVKSQPQSVSGPSSSGRDNAPHRSSVDAGPSASRAPTSSESSKQPPAVNPKPQARPQTQQMTGTSNSARSNAPPRSSVDAGPSTSTSGAGSESSKQPPAVNPKPQARSQTQQVTGTSSSGRGNAPPRSSMDAGPSASTSAADSEGSKQPPIVNPRQPRREARPISRPSSSGAINPPLRSSTDDGTSASTTAVTSESSRHPPSVSPRKPRPQAQPRPSSSSNADPPPRSSTDMGPSTTATAKPMPIPRPRPVSRPTPPAHIGNQRTPNGLTVESLANAMVAGNLATKAASERSSVDLLRPSSTVGPGASRSRPPAPPPARRSGTSIPSMFNSLSRSSPNTPGRLTPQSTGEQGKRRMMTTLRKPKTGSDEEKEEKHRHRKKVLGKKHPNKHHEGDRRRWRDEVTEKERNRYEGVWVSNKGLFVGAPVQKQSPATYASLSPSPGLDAAGMGRRAEERLSPFPGLGPAEQRLVYQHQNASTQSFASNMSTPGSNSGSQPSSVAGGSPYGSLPNPSPSTHNHAQRFSHHPSPNYPPPPPSECVSSLVVRDIWSRSRLPPDILSDIWELVDRSGTGMLCRDEFCAGLWLIDQRLKGRKLPQRLGREVWHSLEGLKGVKKRHHK